MFWVRVRVIEIKKNFIIFLKIFKILYHVHVRDLCHVIFLKNIFKKNIFKNFDNLFLFSCVVVIIVHVIVFECGVLFEYMNSR